MTLRNTLEARVNAATVAVWGQPVSYTPASTGTPESITAIFDAAHALVEMQGEVPVTTVRPVLRVTAADLTVAPAIDDTVVISGTTYSVRDVQQDASGSYRLPLWEV